MNVQDPLRQLYDSLWEDARNYLARGQVEIHPHLADRAEDRRRGLTVLARPSPPVEAQFSAFIQQLSEIAPDQYFYQPGDFHITILSLFTATENFEPYYARLPTYLDALHSVIPQAERFSLAFKGITASRSCVMVQGFPQGTQLERLREGLREALRNHGFGGDLDRRYRITTAHSTIVRFRTQPRDLPRLLEALCRYRDHDFGQMTVENLQLTKHNWYMSAGETEVLADYLLRGA